MRRNRLLPLFLFVLGPALILQPTELLACATCFGKSDSALAQGMNMGILCLLAVLAVVLSGVTGFFVFLARQSARAAVSAGTPAATRGTVTQSDHD